jgi:hypothetical protein
LAALAKAGWRMTAFDTISDIDDVEHPAEKLTVLAKRNNRPADAKQNLGQFTMT